MGRSSRMSSGFILVACEGQFSELRDTESVPRTVSLRRVKRILDEECCCEWHERSGHYDDAETESFGDHEAERQSVNDAQAFGNPDDADDDGDFFEESGNFGDYDGVTEGVADDNDDPTDELLMSIRALSRGGKR